MRHSSFPSYVAFLLLLRSTRRTFQGVRVVPVLPIPYMLRRGGHLSYERGIERELSLRMFNLPCRMRASR